MAESTFTFRVDDELKAAFAEVAASQERTAAQLLRVLMKDAVHRDRELREHDRWFRGEVEQALREADDPATPRLGHEAVRSSWQQQRAALEGRATGRSA
jgi:predicted transcriptional regulator